MLVAVQPCYAVVMVGFGQSASPAGITDDFSSDTSANYTATVGGISIGGGIATGSTDYSDNIVIHETSTGNTNHFVQADLQTGSIGGMSCIVFGASAASTVATGYAACPSDVSGFVKLYSFSGATATDTTKYWTTSPYSADTFTTWKVVKTGTSFELFKGVESQGTLTDSTYTGGQFVGMNFWRVSGYSKPIDNFSGGL